MRQVRLHGPGDVRLDDVDDVEPGPADAVVAVAACGLCGTDVGYRRLGGPGGPVRRPMPLGHEIAGVVRRVGADVAAVTVGDRVVVHPGDDASGRIGNGADAGGLAPFVLVRDAARTGRLVPVPAGMDLEVAALVEPLAVGMRAVDQSAALPGDSVAVFGCGPIGLAAVAALVDRGVRDVVAVDLSPARLDLARRLGARAALDPTSGDVWTALTALHGTTASMLGPAPATRRYIEASGSAGVVIDIIERSAPESTVSVVALHYDPIPTSFLLILMKQLTIRGSMEYPARFADAVDLLGRCDPAAMVTHRFPLDAVDDAFAVLEDSRHCGKVLVTMERGA